MFQLENGLRSVEEWMSSGRWLLYLSKWRMVFFKEKFTYEILYDAYLQFYMSCESICPNGCHLSDKFYYTNIRVSMITNIKCLTLVPSLSFRFLGCKMEVMKHLSGRSQRINELFYIKYKE